MHPTIDEQLSGARRMLDQAAQDATVPVSSLELLSNVRRLLAQVERSWAMLPAFHRSDNQELLTLLMSMRPLAKPAMTQGLDKLIGVPTDHSDSTGEAELNVRLRALLTQLIHDLPQTPEGCFARNEIAAYLRRRIESDPS